MLFLQQKRGISKSKQKKSNLKYKNKSKTLVWFKRTLSTVINKFIRVDSNEGSRHKRGGLSVSFADECGQELEYSYCKDSVRQELRSIYWSDCVKEPPLYSEEEKEEPPLYSEEEKEEPPLYSEEEKEENDLLRAIILLLNPRKRIFEFLHVSYRVDSKTPINDILEQIGEMASDDALKKQSYISLLRNNENGQEELINSVSIQSFNLFNDEMLISVVEGYCRSSMMCMARAIMEKKRIIKALKKMDDKNIPIKELKSSSNNNSNAQTKSDRTQTKSDHIQYRADDVEYSVEYFRKGK